MKLSIIIIFCDKDFHCLEKMTSMIEKYITVEHEVILVDNRNNQVPFETKYKYVSKGKNTYILEGRRQGLDVAEGEYVWFLDIDDELIDYLTEEDLKDRTENILQIPFKIDIGKAMELNEIKRNIRCFGPGVWCRIYKTSVLKEVLKPIKRDIDLVNGEDRFILNAMLSKTSMRDNVYIFRDKYRYLYKASISCNEAPRVTKERLERGMIGDENLDYLYSFLPNTQEYQREKEITKRWNNVNKMKIKNHEYYDEN